MCEKVAIDRFFCVLIRPTSFHVFPVLTSCLSSSSCRALICCVYLAVRQDLSQLEKFAAGLYSSFKKKKALIHFKLWQTVANCCCDSVGPLVIICHT